MWRDQKNNGRRACRRQLVETLESTSSEVIFTVKEVQRLTLEIRLVKTLPEVHIGWKGGQLVATTIIDAWIGFR